jgi:hypothetical protein
VRDRQHGFSVRVGVTPTSNKAHTAGFLAHGGHTVEWQQMALCLCGEGRGQTISTSVLSYKRERFRVARLVTSLCSANLDDFSSLCWVAVKMNEYWY